jgi:F-type H+-transporting ATPase subunit delta
MKINKETRQMARALLRSSFTNGELDSNRVRAIVKSLIEQKPRQYLNILEIYKRLLRFELEKRTAVIETASELPLDSATEIINNLKRKYGADLDTQFVVNQELLGGMRIRVGNDVWDSSVRNRLQRLQQQL